MEWMQWFMAVLYIALACAALWYTIETRRLRLQNSAQMDLLRSQIRLSVAPLDDESSERSKQA